LTAKLRPEQARRMFKLLGCQLIPFLLTFLFRRTKSGRGKARVTPQE
jgi:hypothetical protein